MWRSLVDCIEIAKIKPLKSFNRLKAVCVFIENDVSKPQEVFQKYRSPVLNRALATLLRRVHT